MPIAIKAALVVEEQLRRGAYRRGVERAFVGAGIHCGRQPVFHFVAGEDGIKRQQPVAQGITRDQGHINRDDIGHSRASAQPYLDLREEIVEADLFRFNLDIRIARFKLFDECFGGPAERQPGDGRDILGERRDNGEGNEIAGASILRIAQM